MRINHNIQALNAYRNLSQTMSSTSKSLEKLSSGLRINRAADDAAGLAISEKMRSQIRGLDMAERNALDAVSLIQTGEGALNEVHSILQRMRELSVQASNGTLEDNDRQAIQSEINQLTYEIDRIADTTQFNQKKLFSGSEQGRAFAEISSDQVEYNGNGKWGGIVTAKPTDPAELTLDLSIDFGGLNKAQIDGTKLIINNKTYEIYTDGSNSSPNNGNVILDLSTAWIDGGADTDAVNSINSFMDKLKDAIKQNDSTFADITGIYASDDSAGTPGVIDNGSIVLKTVQPMSPKEANGINVDISNLPNGVQTNPVNQTHLIAKDTADYTNSFTMNFTEAPKDGDELQIGGVTIIFAANGNTSYDSLTKSATVNIQNKDIFSIVQDINGIIQDAKDNGDIPELRSHSVVGSSISFSTDKTEDINNANGLVIQMFDGDFEANKGKDLSLEFQIGANSSESLKISLSVMDAAKLGIGRNSDGSPTNIGINAQNGIDVSTAENARAAIDIYDNAISIVSAERSKLGAYQNRLEHTVSNLQNANENLTSAESRIRDLDMAEEMTNFTRNNILNQAGQAMLAQANQLPQGILQLLK